MKQKKKEIRIKLNTLLFMTVSLIIIFVVVFSVLMSAKNKKQGELIPIKSEKELYTIYNGRRI